ncbi:MAG: Sensor histidine kinase RcsC [Anaerolineae bacterium]|nr:Sensor histidine kinase RcsC [Anaerolineae bacterium]
MTYPGITSEPASSPQWKTQLLNRVLLGMVGVGALAIIYTVIRTISEGRYILLALYSIAYGLLCVIAFSQRVKFKIRAGTLLLSLYLVGVTDLASGGLWSNGLLFLIALVVLTHVLYNLRYGIAATILSLATIAGFAWLAIARQHIFPLQGLYNTTSPMAWIRGGLVFTVTCTIIIFSIGYLVQYLERKLHAQQADYSFISDVLDMAGTMVVLLTPGGQIVRLNHSCSKIFGLTIEKVQGKFFSDVFVLPPGRAEINAKVSQILQTGTSLRQELRAPCQNGGDITILWLISPFQIANANDHLVALGNDITAQKQAERERERLLLAEREQRQFAESLREAGLALTSTLNLDTLLDRLLDHIGRIVPYDAANIMLIDGTTATVARQRGYEKFDRSLSNHIAGLKFDISATDNLCQLVNSRQPAVIPDVLSYPGWINTRASQHLRSWAGAPIATQDKVIACFSLDKIEPGFYRAEHLGRLEIFASQAALAMENVRLFQAEARQRYQAEILVNTATVLTSALELPEVLDNILTQLKQVIPYDSACIFLLEDNGKTMKSVAGSGFERPAEVIGCIYPADDPLTQQLFQTGQPIIMDDAQTNPSFCGWGGTTTTRGWIGVPLINRTRVIGHLTIDSRQVGAYSPDFIPLAKAFANQAAVALVNAQLFRQMEEERQISEALRAFGASLVEARNTPDLLNRILDYLGKVVPFDSTSVMLVEDGIVRIKAARGIPADSPAWSMTFNITDHGKGRFLFDEKQPLIMPDVQKDPRWIKIEGDDYIRSWLGVPLVVEDDVIGVLTLDHHTPDFYTDRHLAIATTFAQQAAIALENASLFDAVNQRVAELEAVRQASLGLTSKLELQDVLYSILETTFQFIRNAKNAHAFLFEDGQLTFGASILEDGSRHVPFALPRRNGLTYTVARQGKTIVISDMKTHPIFADAPPDWEGSIVGIPLKIGAQIVGVMTVSSYQSRTWSPAELRTLELLADQAAIAIENARLYKQVHQHATELERRVADRTFALQTVYQLTQALSQANQFDAVLRLALTHLRRAVPHQLAAGLLVIDTAGLLQIESGHNLSNEARKQVQQTLLDQLTVIPEKIEAHYPEPITDAPHLTTLESMMNAPIIVNKEIVGVLLVTNPIDAPFSPEQERLLQTIADQAAETVRRLQLLLAAEYQRLGSLIADLPNGIVLLDADYRIVLTNRLAAALLPQLTVGSKLTHIGEHAMPDILASALADVPFLIELADSPGQAVEIDANPVTAGPETGGYTLVIRDVTEERLMQKRAQRQERLAAVGQLAAGIAHDFNNILTSIIGYAELLLADPRLLPDIHEDVERITRQGHRAAHLVRQILDFSRQTITEKHPLDLVPFVKETIKLLERTLPENINIVFDAPSDQFLVTADLTQLQQVVTNLAVNARDAMPAGGTLTICLRHAVFSGSTPPPYPDMPLGPWVVLKVMDTGIGIPQENQVQIFEPFFTTKEVGQGTGLGLAQVYGIVKQHDGFIEVDSLLNTGTTFSVYLPPRASPDTAPLMARSLNLPQGQNQLILLVEDDDSVLEIGQTMLKHLGYRVITATNGHEALDLFRQHQPDIDLVLTDMTMPVMGGAELTAALRAQNPSIKVIALTGYPLDSEARQLLSEGFVTWLQKPLRLTTLAETIQHTLAEETDSTAGSTIKNQNLA